MEHSSLALSVGAGVGTLCRFLVQSGLHGRWASIGAAVVSLIFVAAGAFDANNFGRGTVTHYLLQYVEVLAIAAGVVKGLEVAQDKVTSMRNGTGAGIVVLAALLLPSVGCASALTALQPSASETQRVRQTASRIADATKTGLVVLDQASAVVAVLPMPTDQKDAIDCGILSVIGVDTPSATVLRVCGPVPDVASSPLGRGLEELRRATREPSLRNTVATMLRAVDAIVARLQQSGQPQLVGFAAILRVTFGFAAGFLGAGAL